MESKFTKFSMKRANTLSDTELISRILQDQETELFGVLYERYETRVYNKCYSLLKNRSEAQELVQDIFLKVYTSLTGFKSASSFSTWLYSITYRFCIEYLRKAQKLKFDQSGISVDMPDEVENIDDEDILGIKTERLITIMEQLPPLDKAILLMKYQDDMRLKTIQEILGLSESSTKMRIKRAKAKVIKLYIQLYSPKN